MDNAQRKRTLVIGLGWYARQILDDISERFTRYELQDKYLSSIWLPPVETATRLGQQGVTVPLKLDNERLKDLYYQSTTQLWSSVNWRTWGETIIGNRLWGKLAIHTNYEKVYQNVVQQLSNLAGTSGETIYIYVVGHAHDPFASGAFIDLAYLLQNQYLTHLSYRTYGMLILPNMANDPLRDDTPQSDESTIEPGGELAFALLKELNFYQQSPSFYRNYQRQYRFPIENTAPFQRGDLYLIGGNNTLDYGKAIQQCADFVFAQSQSNLTQHLPQSQLNTGTFSTFSVTTKSLSGETDFNARFIARRYHIYQQLQDDNRLDYSNNDVINGWIGNLPTDQSSEIRRVQQDYRQEIQELGDTRVEEHVTTNLFARSRQRVQSREDLDRRFYRVRDALLHANHIANQEISTTLDQINQQMDAQFSQLHQANQWHFKKINAVYEIFISRLNQQIATAQAAIKDNHEPTLRALQNTLHNQRLEYSYYDNRSVLPFRWVINSAVIVAGVLFLFTLGLYVLMVAWVLLTISIIQFVPRYYYQNNLSRSHDEVINAQLDYLQALEQLGIQQQRLIYYEKLCDLIMRRIMYGDMTYTGYLDDVLNTRIHNIRNNVTSVTNTAIDNDLLSTDLADIRQDIFQTMSTVPHNNQTMVRQQLDTITRPIVEQEVDEIPQATQERLNESLELVRTQAELLIALSQQHINQRQIDTTHEIVGVTNLPAHVIEAYQNSDIQVVDYRLTQLGEANKNLSPYMVYIQLQNNLPFDSLAVLQIWHDRYDNVISEIGSTNTGDDPFIYRSRLHPTHIGVASSDLNPTVFSQNLWDYPNFVMAVTMLIRFFSPQYRLRQWCNDLGVNHIPPINFSEFCGALHANLPLVSRLVQDAEEKVAQMPDFRSSMYYADITREIENRYDFMVENYPDWQVWVCQHLLNDIRAQRQSQTVSQRTRSIEALTKIYVYLVN